MLKSSGIQVLFIAVALMLMIMMRTTMTVMISMIISWEAKLMKTLTRAVSLSLLEIQWKKLRWVEENIIYTHYHHLLMTTRR